MEIGPRLPLPAPKRRQGWPRFAHASPRLRRKVPFRWMDEARAPRRARHRPTVGRPEAKTLPAGAGGVVRIPLVSAGRRHRVRPGVDSPQVCFSSSTSSSPRWSVAQVSGVHNLTPVVQCNLSVDAVPLRSRPQEPVHFLRTNLDAASLPVSLAVFSLSPIFGGKLLVGNRSRTLRLRKKCEEKQALSKNL